MIRIGERDLSLLRDLYRFNGLPAPSIIKLMFGNSKYGSRRLLALENEGYVKKKFYYAQNRTKGRRFSQRISAIYYVTQKGLQTIDEPIHPRYVVPDKERLDIHNLIGNIYAKTPSLLSRRDTLDRYELKPFMPVTCAIPRKPPILIHIIGNKKVRKEAARLSGFLQSYVITARHVIVARKFEPELLIPGSYLVPWTVAPTVIANIAMDMDHYTKQLILLFRRSYPDSSFSISEPFIQARTMHNTYHLATLMFATALTRFNLQRPPKNTLVYTPTARHVWDLNVQQGSLKFYNEEDKSLHQLSVKEGKRYLIPINGL